MKFADAIVTGSEPVRFPSLYGNRDPQQAFRESAELRAAIADAMPLDANCVANYVLSQPQTDWIKACRDLPLVPAWKSMFVDARLGPSAHLGILCERSEESAATLDDLPCPEPTVWAVKATLLLRQQGLAIPFATRTTWLRRSDGRPIGFTEREYFLEPDDVFENLFVSGMSVSYMAATFVNCKNVKLTPRALSENFVKRFQQRHTRPPVKYHTIDIVPSKTLDRHDDPTVDKLAKALHMCRGHFRTYTGAGLFGRLRGTFWIETHLRGSAQVGQNIADYRAHAPSGAPSC